MEIKKLILFLIVFSMLIPSYALSQDEEDESNPYAPPLGSTCIGQEERLLPETQCCPGLELNLNTGKCDEVTYKDTSLVSCTTSASCSGGTGCLPQRPSDLFSSVSPGNEDQELMSMVEAQVEDEGVKAPLSSCSHSRECASYSCVSQMCEDKKVCRYVAEGEFAPVGVSCAKNLVKTPSGVCEKIAEAKNPIYLGLLDEVAITTGGQCQFQLDEDARKKSIIAMKSLRAMEWFLANISLSEMDDCFLTIPLLKSVVGETFVETRKGILTNFTDVLNQIESDYATLINAKKESQNSVTVHGEAIKEGDLATRQTSGYDSLMLMYRRNLLFQSYETAMLETIKGANKTIAELSLGQADWKDKDTSWKVGNQTISGYNCGAKYKRWKPFRWKTKYYKATKDRWIYHYEVTGNGAGNASIVKREKVAEYLSLIGGMTKEEAISEFTKSKYYLMDPLMHGGMRFDQFGQKKGLSSGGFLNKGKKDLRHARYLRGDNGSYASMYNFLKPKIKDFYKNLKVKPDQKNFVYEPELMSVEGKDCLTQPGNKGCEKFDAFLEEVLDQGFAQFLAYSASSRANYTGYFTNATTWRRRLFAKLEVDMQNITKYYETVLKHRDDQNACIEKVINGVIDSGILANSDNGLIEGNSNGNLPGASALHLENIQTLARSGQMRSQALVPAKVGPLARSKFSFRLDTSVNKELSKTSFHDGLAQGSSSTEKGAIGGRSSTSALAIRHEEMKSANSKATSAGINVASKENAISSSLDSLGKKNGETIQGQGTGNNLVGAGAFASLGSFDLGLNSGEKGGHSSHSGVTGKEESDDENKNGGSGAGVAEIGAGKSVRDLSESALGLGNGESHEDDMKNGSEVNKTAQGQDGTGLTDSEKERMLTGYERNKSEYEAYEDDGLFNKVSKAYVRNLDKILKRKKKIGDK